MLILQVPSAGLNTSSNIREEVGTGLVLLQNILVAVAHETQHLALTQAAHVLW